MNYRLMRSNRKTIALKVLPDQSLEVRAPYGMPKSEIDAFVQSKSRWIEKVQREYRESAAKAAAIEPLRREQIQALKRAAIEYIPPRVAHYAGKIGVSYNHITLRMQKTRWGSCSAKGNLNFNILLMLTEPEIIDSVIVHELCHRKYMNHSKDFYAEVYRAYPDYDRCYAYLKEHGREIMMIQKGENNA